MTTHAQHMDALALANRTRLARAKLRRQIATGEKDIKDVIMDPPWHCHTMEIAALLMSQKRWGRARTRRLLTTLGIRENRHLIHLTERQRLALLSALGRRT